MGEWVTGNLADWVVRIRNKECLEETPSMWIANCVRGQPRPEIIIRNPCKALKVTVVRSMGWNMLRVFGGHSINGPWTEIYRSRNPHRVGIVSVVMRNISGYPYLKFRLVDGDMRHETIALLKTCEYIPSIKRKERKESLKIMGPILAIGGLAVGLYAITRR